MQISNVLAANFSGGNEQLESAIQQDRQQLTDRLRVILADDIVSQAIYIASSSMAKTMATWMVQPGYERGRKAIPTLASYLLRMTTRPTPFGLFAGSSTLLIASTTDLRLCPCEQYRSHTRLDMGFLSKLCADLGNDVSIRNKLVYQPNPGLYMIAGHWRLAERRIEQNGEGHSYHLVSFDADMPLRTILERAADGACLTELTEALCRNYADVGPDEAQAFVDELIDSQILLSQLEPPVTGPDALKDLIATLQQIAVRDDFLQALEYVANELKNIDKTSLGIPAARYDAIVDRLRELPEPPKSRHMFQVDLYKTTIQGSVGAAVIKTVREGILLLRQLCPPVQDQELQTFIEDFVDRFQDREVPLMHALDEESGIGFGKVPAEQSHTSPLLEGLNLSPIGEALMLWGERDSYLLRMLGDALQAGKTVIHLDEADYQKLKATQLPELPDALSAEITLLADSPESINHGDFKILWHGTAGPSGALLLGRFCHGDARLFDWVKQHLAREEAHRPDAVFAEIVHLPQDRVGNVICRPHLRPYEISYFGRSGLEADRQIPVGDLVVRIVNGRIVLRSKRLGREVIPRLTTAHNVPRAELGVYRFLCTLATQEVAYRLSWDWGPLDSASFLPRIEAGRLILARARWRLDDSQLASLSRARGGSLLASVHKLRESLKLPRWVLLTQRDLHLPLDLDNIICVELLANAARGKTELDLTEMYPAPEDCCVTGPEGRYAHELVIPFELRKKSQSLSIPPGSTPTKYSAQRLFQPCDQWLYVKIYTGPAVADNILQTAIAPIIATALDNGNIDCWFFLRYADPQTHLRIRIHGNQDVLCNDVWPALQKQLQPFIDNETVWRIDLDTYDREIERYGGDVGIKQAEAVFHADSDAVIELLKLTQLEDGRRTWQLVLLSIHKLLDDLDINFDERICLLDAMVIGLKKEFESKNPIEKELSIKYRELRHEVESVLQLTSLFHDDLLMSAIAIFDHRSTRLIPIRQHLTLASKAGKLPQTLSELAQSFIHMTANRLFRIAARAQELVLYEFLLRYYKSILARTKVND